MAKQTPYLQRRGDTFSFRIAVPSDLLSIVGKREFTKSLQTTDKRMAVVKALMLAATAKQLFNRLKSNMSKPDKLRPSVFKQKRKAIVEDECDLEEGGGLSIGFEMEVDLDELGFLKGFRVKGEPHEQEAVDSAIKTVLEHAPKRSQHPTPTSAIENAAEAVKVDSVPMLSDVIDDFLEKYPHKKHPSMYKKHLLVLPMLLQVIGNKPINELKQADINHFFATLEKIPPKWKVECRKKNLSIKELAKLEHSEILGPKSFTDTYKASVRPFLEASIGEWQDQGFPPFLNINRIQYKGSREEGEDKQRAFTQKELDRLFNGIEMKAFAKNSAEAHYYWLPHIGLFTSARVNEICQMNPQTDILQDEESKIWYFWINEETDGDDRIDKRIKNKESTRRVPIHSSLQRLGFLSYVEQVKKQGSKLLFPAWKPMRGKASGEAEKWFIKFLRDIGLRDEKAGARLVGMHAFRHTLLNLAKNATPRLDATSITGHAGESSAIVRGYEGKLWLVNQKNILEAIPFGLDLNAP